MEKHNNMNWTWRDFSQNNQKWLKTAWLIAAALTAIYVGAIAPLQEARGLNASRQTGLGAVAFDPVSAWRTRSVMPKLVRSKGYAGGGGSGESVRGLTDKVRVATMSMNGAPAADGQGEEDRKLTRTCTMDLVVKVPAEVAQKIRQMAEQMGGYLENSQINGSQSAGSASLTIRVPATRIEEARGEIRKLGLRVESDRLEAQDVTKDYVDLEARLRNLHAQEQQYLLIMKRASTVKDTLEVSEQLNEVRGQIEQEQAEFNALSKQVETVAITVSLSAEADAQVFGISWRPLYRLKMAARDGLDGLGDYLATMTALAFYLPTILLWLATILIGAALCWRILRWAARILFVSRKAVLAEKGAN
jgi:Domain of unknown function (DUF4349)